MVVYEMMTLVEEEHVHLARKQRYEWYEVNFACGRRTRITDFGSSNHF